MADDEKLFDHVLFFTERLDLFFLIFSLIFLPEPKICLPPLAFAVTTLVNIVGFKYGLEGFTNPFVSTYIICLIKRVCVC